MEEISMRIKYLIVIALSFFVAAGPVSAQQGLFTKENISRAVGAAAGALLGSKFGEGSGKVVGVAVGALAGYWVGGEVGRRLSQNDRAGIANTTQHALDTGETQAWRNPDSGVYTRVSVDEARPSSARSLRSKPDEVPALELVNAYYTADANVNVRSGPSTDYAIVHTLRRGERVPVIGKVEATDWYMIAEGGSGSGFLYAPLVARSDAQPDSQNAIREAMARGEEPKRYVADTRQCRHITQKVTLPNGKKSAHDFTACRQPDGSWMEV
jgi:surface antigen